jgi:hypothetical protein
LGAGLLFTAVTLVSGQESFVGVVRSVHESLSGPVPEFRERLLRDARALHGVLAAAGLSCLAAYAWAGWRRRSVLQALLGPPAPTGAWRGALLALVLATSSVFLGLRLARDLERAASSSGLTFEERRARLESESPLEPDPEAVRAFREAWRPESGNLELVKVARGRRSLDPYRLSARLFPIRVYLAGNTAVAQETARRRDRRIGWIVRDDGSGRFLPAPEPRASLR